MNSLVSRSFIRSRSVKISESFLGDTFMIKFDLHVNLFTKYKKYNKIKHFEKYSIYK